METTTIKLATAVLRVTAKNLINMANELDALVQEAEMENHESKEHRLDLLYHSGELSVRGYNVLRRNYWIKYERYLETLEQVGVYTSGELLKMRNMGKRTFAEILNLCHKYGVQLADERLQDERKEAEADG